MKSTLRLGAIAALLISTVAAAADKPTRVEIGKRGKAATGFVDVPGFGSGTAFCVHSSGLFVTNEHVIRGREKGDVTVVLNPSLAGEKVLKAKVVRADRALDLALLRVAGTKDLPSLPLGSLDNVAELSDVVAVGFPLGRLLSPDRKEYPAVSVNSGSVTALRYKGKELQHIQVDVSLTFGNSGGPVLDDNGKVIGVVVSGSGLGRGINQAIPVSNLIKFLQAPDIAFAPPEFSSATVHKATEFKAQAATILPGAPEPTLKLVLRADDDEPREYPMKKQGADWIASAVPAGKPPSGDVEITAKFASGSVTGRIGNGIIKIGDKAYRFSELSKLVPGDTPKAVLADGRTSAEGKLSGLNSAEIAVGEAKLTVDLRKANQITFQAAPGVAAITASVVGLVDGKEVARTTVRVPVRDAAAIAPADPSTVPIAPPALDGEKVVKRLPEVYREVELGGGGRYLVFHLPKLKKLAIFDFSEARVTKYIPLTEDKIAFTAGLDAVFVGLPIANRIERWSLTTFEREKSAPPPFKETIEGMVMGYASNGPVVVNGYFLDPQTFRQLPIAEEKGNEKTGVVLGRMASGDGTVFAAWNTHYSPASSTVFALEGNIVKRYDEGEYRHVVPGPDGKTMYTGKGLASRTLRRTDPDDHTYGYCLPAVRGDFFLSLTSATNGKGGGFTAYLRGLKLPIAKLDNADHGISFDGWDRGAGGPWKRVFFVPDAKVIAVLPGGNDQVVLHKFDADAALEQSGLDYFLVTSRPPESVKAGGTFTYPVRVKSKNPKVAFKLDSGPKGMEVSAAGIVTWKVPANQTPGDQDVILTCSCPGQDIFHTFTIRVTK